MTRTTLKAVLAAAIFISTITPVASAATPQAIDLTPQFVQAGISNIDRLQVFEIGGIVVIRGRTNDRAQAIEAARIAQTMGYARVANLVQTIEPPDDLAIARRAERELTIHRSLDGCRFSVSSEGGVLSVAGLVQHELQKDVARQVLRSIDGVRELRTDLQRN
ncbi:MAG TPA: BON domain-containing protein [Thermoanaerobaculia bacterium]